MKKRLSLLMVLMMVLSLVPMSVFATAGSAPGGIIKIDDTETDSKNVTVKLTQASGTMFTTGGTAKLTLNKGEFKNLSSSVVTFDFGGELGTPAKHVGTLSEDGAFKNVAYVNVPPTFQNVTFAKEFDILVQFEYSYDKESAGDITLAVEEQNDSGLDVAKPVVIGVVNEGTGDDMKLSVTDATKKIGFDGGELSKFTVKDVNEVTDAHFVALELPDAVKWDTTSGTGTTISLGGAAVTEDTAASTSSVPGVKQFWKQDDNTLVINVTGFEKSDLNVKPIVSVTKRDASKGDVTLKVMARKTHNGNSLEKVDAVIGAIADYDVTMTAWEKGKKEIPAMYGGEEATIKVKLAGVKGSFSTGREIDFTLKGADVVTSKTTGNIDNTDVKPADSTVITVSGGKADDKKVEDGEFTLKVLDGTVKDFEFELKVKADYAQNGAVTLEADSRDFGKVEAEIAKVTPAYTVETKVTSIKKGETLATADVVIKEAKAGLIDSDSFLVINLNDKSKDTLSFGKGYKVEATNGMKVKDELFDEYAQTRRGLNTLVLEVETSSSKEAATITVKDLMVSVDGSAVDGEKVLATNLVEKDDLDSARFTKKDRAAAVNYVFANDSRTYDAQDPNYETAYVNVVKEYGSVATTTVFKIGSKEYTVNGETKMANEAPFISGKGYTMLPVRAVGEALGLKADWNSATKTATFSNDAKVASVVIGADTMYVNGTPVKLAAKAEIKNGSTFVELRSLASAFMVELEWDAATKSVTIKG